MIIDTSIKLRSETGVTMLEVALLVSLISVVAIAGMKQVSRGVILANADAACVIYHQTTNGHGLGLGNISSNPRCHCRTANPFGMYRPLTESELAVARAAVCSQT